MPPQYAAPPSMTTATAVSAAALAPQCAIGEPAGAALSRGRDRSRSGPGEVNQEAHTAPARARCARAGWRRAGATRQNGPRARGRSCERSAREKNRAARPARRPAPRGRHAAPAWCARRPPAAAAWRSLFAVLHLCPARPGGGGGGGSGGAPVLARGCAGQRDSMRGCACGAMPASCCSEEEGPRTACNRFLATAAQIPSSRIPHLSGRWTGR